MKIQVRRNTFETNSSSMHSLVVMKGNKVEDRKSILEDVYITEDNILHIYDDADFGRAIDFMTKPIEKFEYLVALYDTLGDTATRDEVIEVFSEILGVSGISFEYGYGHVDHQSVSLFPKFIKTKGVSIKDFILDSKYAIVIDGDEYFKWEDLKKSGLIDTDNIEEEFSALEDYYKENYDEEFDTDLDDFDEENEI